MFLTFLKFIKNLCFLFLIYFFIFFNPLLEDAMPITIIPFLQSFLEIDFPIPELAPVTIATFFFYFL
ncbi:MAG: hypothetical protein BucCj_2220 [Buchnera aphidicola (Ceratovacuna japonica)]